MVGNLKDITTRQKKLLSELESEVKQIENNDLTKENEQLKKELAKLNEQYAKSEQNAKILSEQNTSLKNALYEQTYNEKVAIVNATQEKLDIYFRDTFEAEQNRLNLLEKNIKTRIHNMITALKNNNIALDSEISQNLGKLATQVNIQITEAQATYAKIHGAFSENELAEFEKLKEEQITDKQIIAVTKKDNLERFVGLNLLNKIGILLIIIGVITAAHYTYFQLSYTLRGIMMFTLGAAMLMVGEILNKKKSPIYFHLV